MSDLISLEQLKKSLPAGVRKNVTTELLDKINDLLMDPDCVTSFKSNLLSYTSVMKDGRFKISQYINAVKYVSCKLLGMTNSRAWEVTFPNSHQRLIDKGAQRKDISAHVASYNKSKLVNLIYEQTLVPTYVLNADMYQDALNVQADLMMNVRSEKVKSDAANSLLTHLKRPEAQKLAIDVNVREDDSIQALRESTLELVRQQRKMIEEGHCDAKAIAESQMIIVQPEV